MAKEYMNMSKTAEYIGLNRRQLYRMIHDKRIKGPDKVGGHSLYSKTYVDNWMIDNGYIEVQDD